MTTKQIGIDPGFGNFKVAWINDEGQIETRVIPSVAGLGQVRDLSGLGLGEQTKMERPLTVNWSGISYLVGENVHRHTEPIEDLDYQRLSEGSVNQALFYSALGSSVNGQPTQVELMLGFPVEVLADRDQARAALASIRAWLMGPHAFSVDGRPVEVEVIRIKAVGQPVGAYFDWGLDAAGEPLYSNDVYNKPVAVCDVGFNTIDLFAVEGGAVVDRFTAGNNLGMHRVAQAVAKHVRDQYEVELSLHEADLLVRQHLAGRPALLYCAAGEVDLAGVIGQALSQTFTDIKNFIRQAWGRGGRQFYKLIFSGGGPQGLRPQFLRQYPAAYLPTDLITSNARGLLKYARRVFRNS
jgi:hypothetical protein